jgi:hypothetical protein
MVSLRADTANACVWTSFLKVVPDYSGRYFMSGDRYTPIGPYGFAKRKS